MIDQTIDGSDAETIARFLEGDDRAFTELVCFYQRRVYNLALSYLRVPEEAQEVTQEIFIKVFRSLKGFRGEAKFSTWLYAVAINHCRNRLKYLHRRHYFSAESFDPPADPGDDSAPKQYASAEPDQKDRVYEREVRQAVRGAIGDLGEDHREAIILRDLQGLSYEEIAEITGEAIGTVKSRIHRARLELAHRLKPFVETEGLP
jgi:RNA polymerase sigma-70 factor, ECF subfamily